LGLTPLDIHNKEFRKSLFRGYDSDEVDEFLDQVIREFELLIKENSSMREQLESMRQRVEIYRSQEETINQVLVVAQATAEDLKANAKREADLIIQEARLQAERIIDSGQTKATRIMEQNSDLVRVAHALRTQLRSLLQSQLETLENGLRGMEAFLQAAPSLERGAQPSAVGAAEAVTDARAEDAAGEQGDAEEEQA
jgi:cell division initiation protein